MRSLLFLAKLISIFEQAENLPEPAVPLKLAKGFLPMAKMAIAYYTKATLAR